MKTKTYTAGANAERDAVKAYVKRLATREMSFRQWAGRIIEWLLKRDDRYNQKRKGVGK